MPTTWGILQSIDPTYSNAVNGTGSFSVISGNNAIGQFLTTDPDYQCNIGYLSFDTSNLDQDPDILYFGPIDTDSYTGTDVTFNIAQYDYGSTLTSADWLDPAALSALTVIGSVTVTGGSGNNVVFTIDTSGLTFGGVLKFVIFTADQAAATPPADNGFGSGASYGYPANGQYFLVARTHATTVAAGSWATEIAADSPETWWRFDETSGTVAADSSGNGNDGTYINSPTLGVTGLIPGDSSTAINTSNVDNSHVQGTEDFSSAAFTSGLTLEAIFTAPDVSEALEYFPVVGLESESNNEIDIETWGQDSDGNSFFALYVDPPGVDDTYFLSFGYVSDNTVTHVAATLPGDYLINKTALYINGDQYRPIFPPDDSDSPRTLGLPLNANTGGPTNLYGAGDAYVPGGSPPYTDGDTDSMTGTLDEVALYETQLPYSRILVHYQASLGGSPGANLSDTVGITDQLSTNRPGFTDVVGITDSLHSSQESASFSDVVGITDSLGVVVHGKPYRNAVLADSPVLLWALDETSGTVATDETGNGNVGTYEGSPLQGQPGLTLDGGVDSTLFQDISPSQQDVVSAGTFGPGDYPAGATIEAIIEWSPGYESIRHYWNIAGFAGTDTNNDLFNIYLFNGGSNTCALNVEVNQNPNEGFGFAGNESNPGTILSGQKYHVVGIFDGTNTQVYINGLLAGTSPYSSGTPFNFGLATADPFWAAGDVYGGGVSSDQFPGYLNYVAFYDYVLDDRQIINHYNASGIGPPVEFSVTAAFNDTVGITDFLSVATVVRHPTLISISPTTGDAETRNTIAITGTNLDLTSGVFFGTEAAASFIINSSTSVTAVSPILDAGTYTVRIGYFSGLAPGAALYVAVAPAVASGALVVKGSPSVNSRTKPAKVVPISTINSSTISTAAHISQATSKVVLPRLQGTPAALPQVTMDSIGVTPIRAAPQTVVSRGTHQIIGHPVNTYENVNADWAMPFHDSMFGITANTSGTLFSGVTYLYEVVPAADLPTGWSVHIYPSSVDLGVENLDITPELSLSDTVLIGFKLISEFVYGMVALVRNGTTIHLGPVTPLPLGTDGFSDFPDGIVRISDTEFAVGTIINDPGPTTFILGCSVTGDAITIESQSILNQGPDQFSLLVNGNSVPIPAPDSTLVGPVQWASEFFAEIIHYYDGILLGTAGLSSFEGQPDILWAWEFSAGEGITGVVGIPHLEMAGGFEIIIAAAEGEGKYLALEANTGTAVAIYFDGSTFSEALRFDANGIAGTDPFGGGIGFPQPYLFTGFENGFVDVHNDNQLVYYWGTQTGATITPSALQVGIDFSTIPGESFFGGTDWFQQVRHANNIVVGFAILSAELPGPPFGQGYPPPTPFGSFSPILMIAFQAIPNF